MKNLFKISIPILFLFARTAPLLAQTDKYVVSAELHISMTHPLWPDVFLNGHQIVDSQEHVFDRNSNIDQPFSKEELCYFSTVNCLAIKVPQTLGSTTGTNAVIGLAYVLKVSYSDNTADWITSDQGKTRKYFVKKNRREPSGWTAAGFDDHAWALARPFRPTAMGVTLINPQTGSVAKYFPTFQDNANLYSTLGQSIYFRRKYVRDVTAPPDCGKPIQLAPLKVQPMPKPVWTGVVPPTPTFTPWPVFTPVPTATPVPPEPTATFKPVWTATAFLTLMPTAGWTDTPYANGNYHEPFAVNSSAELKRSNLGSRPEVSTQAQPNLASRLVVSTQVPTPRPKIRHKPKRTPTSTPTIFIPLNIPTRTLSVAPVSAATAAFTAGTSPDSGMAATIVFASPPVNINASFADGPGVYRLEIVDSKGLHINTLYNQQVVLEKDTWITWDGTNDEGKPVGYGNYVALLSKDGVLIEKIALTWIAPNTSQNNP